MQLSHALRKRASPPVDDRLIGASRRAARAFGPTLKLRALERMVLAWLVLEATMQDGEGRTCHATHDVAADAMGCSIKSIQRAQRKLAAGGYLSVRQVPRGQALKVGLPAPSARAEVTVADLPAVAICGLRGALTRAFDPALMGRDRKTGKLIPLKANHRAVLAMYLLHGDETGWSWVGYGHMSAMLGLSERIVGDLARDLLEWKHVCEERQKPTWDRPFWRIRRKATPMTGLRSFRTPQVVGSAPVSTANDQGDPGHFQQAARSGLPPKEIPEGDPLPGTPSPRSKGRPVQLDLFAPRPGTAPSPAQAPVRRSVEVSTALAEHERLCRAPAGPEAEACLSARLGEGLGPDDLTVAFQGVMASSWRRERLDRRSVASVCQTKAQVLSFVRRVDPDRAAELERGAPTRGPDVAKAGAEQQRPDVSKVRAFMNALNDRQRPAW